MKKLMILLVSLVAICETTTAQNSCDRWYMDVNYTFLQPLQNFNANGFHEGHGASWGLYYDFKPNAQKVTFHSGLRLNGIVGKNAKDNIALADPVGATAKTRVYNSIFDAQALGRIILQPQNKLSLYLEGHGGLRVSTGHEKLNLQGNYPGYDETTSTQVISKANWNWGGGIGGLIRLHPMVDFDIRLSADYSPELEYIDMDTYEKIEDNLVYDFSKSNALDYKIHIGFRFKLGCKSDSNRRYDNRNSSPRRSRNRGGRAPSKKKPGTGSSSKS